MPEQVPVADAVRAADIIDHAIDTAGRYGHTDLLTRLRDSRHLLRGPTLAVRIAGQARQGKKSLFSALIAAGLDSAGESGAAGVSAVIPFRLTPAGADLLLIDDQDATPHQPGSEPPPPQILLFVSDASQELTSTELDFLRSAGEEFSYIILVQTKTDICPQWRRIMELNSGQLSAAGIPATTVAVSTVLKDAARRYADADLAARSGFPALIARLDEFRKNRPATALRDAGNMVHSALDELTASLTDRLQGTDERERTAELRGRLGATQRRARRLREKSARWQQILNDGFAAITSDIEFDLKIRARSVLAEAEKAIDEGDPSRNWEPFERWLRARLANETVQNYEQLVASTRELSQKVADHLELGNTVAELADVVAPTEVAGAIDTETAFTQRGGIGRTGLAVFQRGYGGFMMFIVLTHYVAAIAVPMPFGIAAALVMGGAGFGDERKRQLEKRRSQAKSAVRNYIDQFNLHVGKDARGTLKRMQREMRDTYAIRLIAAQRAVDDALQAAETALDEAEAESPAADLATVEQDLRTLATLHASWPEAAPR